LKRAFLFVFLVGCASAQKAANAAKLGAQAVTAAEPILVAAYESAQEACLRLGSENDADKECIRQVRAQFEPVISSIHMFHESWCALDDVVGSSECQ
jgi:hypothetical protein